MQKCIFGKKNYQCFGNFDLYYWIWLEDPVFSFQKLIRFSLYSHTFSIVWKTEREGFRSHLGAKNSNHYLCFRHLFMHYRGFCSSIHLCFSLLHSLSSFIPMSSLQSTCQRCHWQPQLNRCGQWWQHLNLICDHLIRGAGIPAWWVVLQSHCYYRTAHDQKFSYRELFSVFWNAVWSV